jgi:hypothetical protein
LPKATDDRIPGMDKFIWIGRHCVNLDSIVRFTLEDDGRITVLLKDVSPQDTEMALDGDEAESLRQALAQVELGRPEEEGPRLNGYEGIPAITHSLGAPQADDVGVTIDIGLPKQY